MSTCATRAVGRCMGWNRSAQSSGLRAGEHYRPPNTWHADHLAADHRPSLRFDADNEAVAVRHRDELRILRTIYAKPPVRSA
jgi:hypothetical protein